MTHRPNATYHCTVCGVIWSYEAVRHLACCRDCGSGLLRTLPTLELGGAADEGAEASVASKMAYSSSAGTSGTLPA
jgi:predicted  nucleic acid-binding Zn-ribbon protein